MASFINRKYLATLDNLKTEYNYGGHIIAHDGRIPGRPWSIYRDSEEGYREWLGGFRTASDAQEEVDIMIAGIDP